VKDTKMVLPTWVCVIFAVIVFGSGQGLAMFLPVIYVQGSHYQIGLDIGKTFYKEINDYYDVTTQLKSEYIPWYKSPEGKKLFEGFLYVANTSYPQYIQELQGIADGIERPFYQVLLMNMQPELSGLLHPNQLIFPDACSDVMVNNNHTVAYGHNEDNAVSIRNRGYVVVAKVKGNATLGIRDESFTAYSYPGILPGNAFGFNDDGLVIAINALFPAVVQPKKTFRNIITRALLAAQSVKEVDSILADENFGCAYGFSVNLGVLPSDDRNERPHIYNYELAPQNSLPGSNVSKYMVPRGDGGANNGSYFHVNMYRRIHITQGKRFTPSSVHRTKRIEAMPNPTSIEDIKQILGDTADQQYPIYRHPTQTDPEDTIATALIDLRRCTMKVYRDNPKTSTDPLHTFRLPCEDDDVLFY